MRHVLPAGRTPSRHTAEFLIAAGVRTGRLVTGVDWCPREVRFVHHRPATTAEHERFFRAPVRFATGENALILADSTLCLPCVAADPALASLLDRYAHEHMPTDASRETISDRVRSLLVASLRDGEPSASAVAARMKMSVRTLNRSLAADGTTYRRLLDQLRRDIASRSLADPHSSIAEVAFLLGFAESSAFYRAFRRWTGQTPAEYRARVRDLTPSRRR